MQAYYFFIHLDGSEDSSYCTSSISINHNNMFETHTGVIIDPERVTEIVLAPATDNDLGAYHGEIV